MSLLHWVLTRPTAELSVGEIILAVDEPIDATQCGGKENCRDERKCITHDLWTDLNRHIFEYLDSVKLSDLVEKQKQTAPKDSVVELVDRRESKAHVIPETV